MKLKGQASIEYMAVFGLALVLSAPFILSAQTSLLDLSLGSGTLEAQNSLDKIEVAVKTVAASGEPAQRTFDIDIPRNYVSHEIGNSALMLTVRNRGGETDLIRSFNTELDPDTELPDSPGSYRLTVYMQDGNATIEVVE